MIRGHVIAAGLRQHGGALGKKLRQYKGIGGPCDLKRFQESPLRNVSLGWTPPVQSKVVRLFPSKLEDILERRDPQLVLVATFSTLVTLFNKEEYRSKYPLLAAKLSQVFVDEGHYEPAVEWGQAVKELRAPTLLLTATPYRNDLKLFQVKKEDVCHSPTMKPRPTASSAK